MRFIELLNFQTAPEKIQFKLRHQLGAGAQTSIRWVLWTSSMQSLVAHPDITLVYAANLSWRTLKMLTDQTQDRPIVLYGVVKPLLGMPILSNIECIDDLQRYFDGSDDPIHITAELPPESPVMYIDWKPTIPLKLSSHA